MKDVPFNVTKYRDSRTVAAEVYRSVVKATTGTNIKQFQNNPIIPAIQPVYKRFAGRERSHAFVDAETFFGFDWQNE